MPLIGDINRLTGGYLYQKKLAEYLRSSGAEVDIISVREMPYPLYFGANFWFLGCCLRKKYDLVIEDEMVHPALWLFNLWARHIRKMKIVAIVHLLRWVAMEGSWQAPLTKLLEKLMLTSAHLIIANSKDTKVKLESMGFHRQAIEVVHPGFDIPYHTPSTEPPHQNGIKILFVGNLLPGKGVEFLLEAIHHLKSAGATLDVVGDEGVAPGYSRRLKEMVAHGELKEKVRFRGRVAWEVIGDFYSGADIFVLPSRYEAYGTVLAEAMSFGLPIVATNVGGIPEIVAHGKNGLLVPPGDARSLAAAINKFVLSASLREEFSKASYERSTELNSWEDTCRTIWEHLHHL